MAEKTKSAVWQFQRLNARDGETYQLNKDEPTKIGRNETSDIFCNTKLASRNHCTVTIEEDYDRIVVSDFSSNGTFVNNVHVHGCTRELRSNDVVGIGCNMQTFNASHPENFYLLKLKNLEDEPIVTLNVDLTAEEDVEMDNKEKLHRRLKIEPLVENVFNADLLRLKQSPIYHREEEPVVEDVPFYYDLFAEAVAKPEPVAGPSGISTNQSPPHQMPSTSLCVVDMDQIKLPDVLAKTRPKALSEPVVPADNDADEEAHFSQQMVREIKQEVDQSFEYDSGEKPPPSICNVDPFVISDDDDELNEKDERWIAKVRETPKESKRRSVKYIDPMPQVKKRRCSVSEAPRPPPHRPFRGEASTSSVRPPINAPVRRKSISDDVKSKLAELAAKNSSSDADRSKSEAKKGTRPKVKESKSRGDFLIAEQPPAPIGARRKSVDATRAVQPGTSKDNTSHGHGRNAAGIGIKPYETILKPKNVPVKRTSRVSSTVQNEAGSSKAVLSGDKISPVEPLGHVDHFDPFAVIANGKPKAETRTFDEALQGINRKVPKNGKRRSSPLRSHASMKASKKPATSEAPPTAQSHVSPKSILRKANQTRIPGRNVEWKIEEISEVKVFEAGSDEDGEILLQVLSFGANEDELPLEKLTRASNFQKDPLHKVITNVLQWDVDWLSEANKEPPVNGYGLIESPMLQQYESYEMYQSTIVPLMMHELWANIRSEGKRPSFDTKIVHADDEQRGVSVRRRFMCESVRDAHSNKINVCDLVVVEAGGAKFFAYVTEAQSKYNTVYFTIEMSRRVVNEKIPIETTALSLRVLANIRTEMKLFSAVFTLKECPLREYLLCPMDGSRTPKSRLPYSFNYNGYDELSTLQQKILEDVYAECKDDNKHVTLIEGPPGTGKSRLIISLILQMVFSQEVRKPMKILLCAPSNAAVDVLANKLIKIRQKILAGKKRAKLNIVRHGVFERIHKDVQPVSVKALLERKFADEYNRPDVAAWNSEVLTLTKQIEHLEQSEQNGLSKDKIQKLRQKKRQVQELIEQKLHSVAGSGTRHMKMMDLINGATVICTTLTSALNLLPFAPKFDVCLVDEASQCTEPWTLVPLLFGLSSMILVGDSQQLPAVVLSGMAKKLGFERSLFTRIQEAYIGSEIRPNVYSLFEQFRMHPDICHFSNQYFYAGKLVTNKMAIDSSFGMNAYNVFSLEFLQSSRDTFNYHNTDEADFIIDVLKVAIKFADPRKYSYGIITPYSGQKQQIEKRLRHYSLQQNLYPVNTIDSYQGQEKDIIIISYARTIGTGFLSEPNRLNVAMTRAKKCLIICANFTALKSVPVWKSLLEDAKKRRCLYSRKDAKTPNSEFIKSCLVKPP